MKRKATVVAAVAAGLIVLLVLIVPLLVNAERFRPTVEARLTQALARPVKIGHLRFSWLAGGVSAQEITIGEDPSFGTRPFLTAKALDVSVDLMPLLLRRDLRIESLSLREPELRLQQKSGRWNIASLGKAQTAQRPTTPAAAGSSPGMPLLLLRKFSISGARLLVESPGSSQTYTDVNVAATDVSPAAAFPFTLTAKVPGDGKLRVEGKLGPAADFSNLPAQATLNLDHLDLARSGYFGRDSGLAGAADLKATLRSDGRSAHVEGASTVDRLQLLKNSAAMRRPVKVDFMADYDLKSAAGRVSRGDLRIGQSVVHLTGAFDARNSPPALNLTLAAQGFPMTELQELLPALGISLPGGASLQGGSASTTLAAAGPADRLVITGPLKLTDVVIAGFNLGSNLKTVAALAGINTGNDTRVQSLDTRLRVAPEGITFADLNALISGMGTLTGGGVIGADHRLNFRLVAQLSKGGGLLGGILKQTGVGQLSTVPFRIEGTTTNPAFLPDVNAIVQTQRPPASAPAQPQQNPLGGLLNQLWNKKK
jgi:AsmA protein